MVGSFRALNETACLAAAGGGVVGPKPARNLSNSRGLGSAGQRVDDSLRKLGVLPHRLENPQA